MSNPLSADAATYSGKCPKCGEGFQKKLSWLKDHSQFPCPSCGDTITVNKASIQEALNAHDAAAKALDKLPPWMRRS